MSLPINIDGEPGDECEIRINLMLENDPKFITMRKSHYHILGIMNSFLSIGLYELILWILRRHF